MSQNQKKLVYNEVKELSFLDELIEWNKDKTFAYWLIVVCSWLSIGLAFYHLLFKGMLYNIVDLLHKQLLNSNYIKCSVLSPNKLIVCQEKKSDKKLALKHKKQS